MLGERPEVTRIGGQDNSPSRAIRLGGNNRVDGGGDPRSRNGGAEQGSVSRKILVNGLDDAQAQKSVLMEVSPVIAGESLYQDGGGNDRGPFPSLPYLLQPSAAPGKH